MGRGISPGLSSNLTFNNIDGKFDFGRLCDTNNDASYALVRSDEPIHVVVVDHDQRRHYPRWQQTGLFQYLYLKREKCPSPS